MIHNLDYKNSFHHYEFTLLSTSESSKRRFSYLFYSNPMTLNMPYDEYQAERIARILEAHKADFYSKKMFSGMVFMVDDKMCIGTHIDKKSSESLLMIRIGNAAYEANKDRPGCQPMDFTGRRMKDYAFIRPDGYDADEDLEHWVRLALALNPFAKPGKKPKKKVD